MQNLVSDGPYVCNGKPYIRVQSTTKVMPQEKYKRLLSAQLSRTPWEDSTNNHCTIADLDKNRIKQVVRIAITENRLPEDEAMQALIQFCESSILSLTIS